MYAPAGNARGAREPKFAPASDDAAPDQSAADRVERVRVTVAERARKAPACVEVDGVNRATFGRRESVNGCVHGQRATVV
jgi:hypothetical protein